MVAASWPPGGPGSTALARHDADHGADPDDHHWAIGLGRVFARVAILRIQGTDARLTAASGVVRHNLGHNLGRTISLVDQTPLRWAIEAASPIIMAGGAPGAAALMQALEITTPRVFAVLPLVVAGRLIALAYGDCEREPLPLGTVAELLRFCTRALEPGRDNDDEEGQEAESAAFAKDGRDRTRGQRRGHDHGEAGDPLGRWARHAPADGNALTAMADDETAIAIKALLPLVDGSLGGAPHPSLRAAADDTASPTSVPHLLLPVAPQASQSRPDPQPTASIAGFVDGSFSHSLHEITALAATLASETYPLPEPGELAWLAAQPSVARFESASAQEGESRAPDDDARPTTTRAAPRQHSGAPDVETQRSSSSPSLSSSPLSPRAHSDAKPDLDALAAAQPAAVDVATPPPATSWWVLGPRLFVGSAAVAFAITLAMVPLAPPGANLEPRLQLVQVERHQTLTEISEQLGRQGLIRSPLAFRWLARLIGSERTLRAGRYRLPSGAWAWQVLSELRRGQIQSRTLTIPEGFGLEDIARELDRNAVATASQVLHAARDSELRARYRIPGPTLDGYLFPDTYSIAEGVHAGEVLEMMLQQFFRKLQQLPQALLLTPLQLFDTVKLASIVQRETSVPSEMPRVAGVFRNRLDNGMRLESCATVQYALGTVKERLSLADVRTPSPYNTYLHEGLPPGPISNPGLEALRAALQPEPHDFLFFFARRDDSDLHVFTHTFSEHKTAQQYYR